MVYWRSSSGALSFRSSVSTATTTLDTWLGLSGRNRRLRTESHTSGQPMPHKHHTRCASVLAVTEGRVQSDSMAPVLHQPPHNWLNTRFQLARGSQQPPG